MPGRVLTSPDYERDAAKGYAGFLCALVRWRQETPNPTSAVPSSKREPGSGTDVLLPVVTVASTRTSNPCVVPTE
jgi:hypothetical protein